MKRRQKKRRKPLDLGKTTAPKSHTYGDAPADLELLKQDLTRAIHVGLEAVNAVATLGHRINNVIMDLDQIRKNCDRLTFRPRGS